MEANRKPQKSEIKFLEFLVRESEERVFHSKKSCAEKSGVAKTTVKRHAEFLGENEHFDYERENRRGVQHVVFCLNREGRDYARRRISQFEGVVHPLPKISDDLPMSTMNSDGDNLRRWKLGRKVYRLNKIEGLKLNTIIEQVREETGNQYFENTNSSELSKLSIAYRRFIEELGFSFEDVENVSPFSCYIVHTSGFIRGREDAEKAINLLEKGIRRHEVVAHFQTMTK